MDGGTGPVAARRRTLSERFADWRCRWIARPEFQTWAARFPFTRHIARGRALSLFDLTAGFVYAQVLQACVSLEVFDRLAGGPQTADGLAAGTGVPPERLDRLLAAAVSLGLLSRRGEGLYALDELGASVLGAPGLSEMIRHHALFYRDLADPVALLRGETEPELARFWGYVGGERTHALEDRETVPYTQLMAATQAMVASEVLTAYRVSRHRRLLDVGGGDGSFLVAAGRAAPGLELRLFDLPAVVPLAESRFAEAGMSDRAEARGGDFFADPLPEGADAISLVRVVYDHDDEAVRRLLSRVHDALPPGGRLLLAEPMAETPRAPRVGDAYFGFYLMAMTHGRPRTAARLTALLAEAGFGRIRVRPTLQPILTGLITADRF